MNAETTGSEWIGTREQVFGPPSKIDRKLKFEQHQAHLERALHDGMWISSLTIVLTHGSNWIFGGDQVMT